MHQFPTSGSLFLEGLRLRLHMSLRKGSLLLTVEAFFDTPIGHMVIPPPIFLWIGRGGIPVLYLQIKTVLPEGFAIKLKAIIRDEDMGNPESSYNILPDESLDIYISDIGQRFSLNPLGKIICAD